MRGWKEALTFLRSERVQETADTVLETSFLGFLLLLFFSPQAANFALILLGLSLNRPSPLRPFLLPADSSGEAAPIFLHLPLPLRPLFRNQVP